MNYQRKYFSASYDKQSARTAIEPKACNMVNTGYAAQHYRWPVRVASLLKGALTLRSHPEMETKAIA